MNAGVPTTSGVPAPGPSPTSRAPASPKSATHTRPIAGHQHVLGLEVAVHDPGVVRRREPAPRGDEARHESPPRSAPRRSHAPRSPPSISSIATNSRPSASPISCTATMFGCWEPRERPAPRGSSRRCGVGAVVQQLDRDPAIEARDRGRVDRAHAAAAEPLDHAEAARSPRARRRPPRPCPRAPSPSLRGDRASPPAPRRAGDRRATRRAGRPWRVILTSTSRAVGPASRRPDRARLTSRVVRRPRTARSARRWCPRSCPGPARG